MIKMCNKKLLIILSVLLCLLLAGCNALTPIESGTSAPATQTETPEPTATPEIKTPEKVTLTADDGTEYELTEDSETITIDNAGLIPALISSADALPKLKSISLADALEFTYDDVSAIREAYPDAQVDYKVVICGGEIDPDATDAALPGLKPEDIGEAVRELRKLAALERVDLNENDGVPSPENGAVFYQTLTLEDVNALETALPGVVFDYNFSLYGKVVSTADERIEFVDTEIGDEGIEAFREILPSMTNLTYLKLDDCGVSSPVMAELRDDFPDIKVVWRIYFSAYGEGLTGYVTYNCLTDTERIWATGCVTDGYDADLKYCTDVKYLDLGHNCITNIDFINYMPKLEVAVLSITWIKDLSPLGNCPNLEFLEIYSSDISDISALANCKNLKHLNLGNDPGVTDITPIYGLDLERCYINVNNVPNEQEEEFIRLHPDCECSFDNGHPVHLTWRFLPGYTWKQDGSETHYNERYALLREQIGYDDYSNISA